MPLVIATLSGLPNTELFSRMPIIVYSSISVFHGTPHDFDEFSTEAIGTGTGAQVFGWGMYFSDSQKVADDYRTSLCNGVTQKIMAKHGDDPSYKLILDDLKITRDPGLTRENMQQVIDQEYASNKQHREDIQEEMAALDFRKEKYGLDILEEIQYEGLEELLNVNVADHSRIEAHEKALTEFDKVLATVGDDLIKLHGRLFHADIPDGPYLIWDSSEQPEETKQILKQHGVAEGMGSSIYHTLSSQKGGPKAASQYLDSIGIVGNRHSIGSGNSNFIIFNSKNVKITKKY